MSIDFRTRYLEIMITADDDIIDKRINAVESVQGRLSVAMIPPLVATLNDSGTSGPFLDALRAACKESDASFPDDGNLRELKHLAVEVVVASFESDASAVTDALATSIVTASWRAGFESEHAALINRAKSYVKLRQKGLRRGAGLHRGPVVNGYPDVLKETGLTDVGNPALMSHVYKIANSLNEFTIDINDRFTNIYSDMAFKLAVVEEMNAVISACLSQFSECCDETYADLGGGKFVAAAYDLAQITVFDLGLQAAPYYMMKMIGNDDTAITVADAIKQTPPAVRSRIADESISSDVTPLCFEFQGYPTSEQTGRTEGIRIATQLYQELLLWKMLRSAKR